MITFNSLSLLFLLENEKGNTAYTSLNTSDWMGKSRLFDIQMCDRITEDSTVKKFPAEPQC